MWFTLLFDHHPEGPSLSFDLVFHPCPEWYKHGESLVVPNSKSQYYQIGHLKHLLDKAEIELENLNSNRVGIVCHQMGIHKGMHNQECLFQDLKQEGFNPHVVRIHENFQA